MRIRTRRRALASLEGFAITDIILNMFIFFFTSFSLVYTFNPTRESRIQVKLPEADVRTEIPREPILVTVDEHGQPYIGGKPIALGDLAAGVRAALGGDPDAVVIVRADRSVIFDRVVKVLEAVKQGGAQRLSIAVEQRASARR